MVYKFLRKKEKLERTKAFNTEASLLSTCAYLLNIFSLASFSDSLEIRTYMKSGRFRISNIFFVVS